MNVPFLSRLFEGVPDDPFYQPRRPLCLPPEMVTPPKLADPEGEGQLERCFALLINPFYPKDAHASFGKHALRPLKKIWIAAVTLDVTNDPSLIREMALAGCTGVFIGFESLSDDNLACAPSARRSRKTTPDAFESFMTTAFK